MRPFEVSDNVVLKPNPTLYGYIQRTHSDANDSLEDELIIAHADVPPDALNEFVTTGVPPVGYVYVQFSPPSAGASLVHESDLELLSRTFRLGDFVRRDGSHSTGTVVDIQESYILNPTVSKVPGLSIPAPPLCTSECPSLLPPHLSHANPHQLLYDVPSREVQRAQDVTRDDYIITGNWVGLVYELEYDIVLMLEDQSVVVVTGPYGLHTPVPDFGKPIIALPETDGFMRPDILEATQGWAQTIPAIYIRPGDFVVVDRNRLRYGRWISGAYNPRLPAQGIVMDSRAREVSVDWMSSSLSPEFSAPYGMHTAEGSMPPDEIEIYTDNRTFSNTASIRRKPDVVVYDAGKMPTSNAAADDSARALQPVVSSQDLGIGLHVKFRDISAAAVKYQGTNGTTHGKLTRIPIEASRGWDLNEFEIVWIDQHVSVMWQDGTVTTHDSKSLSGFATFEPEIAPTDIVLKRQGMQQKPVDQRGQKKGVIKDFNEMAFFERPHDLLPASVGVVQSVDATERVASVRWYKSPKVELRSSGQVLSMDSHFGPIGDHVEDVSLYEIMTFPSLMRQRSDMCVITSPGESKAQRHKRRNRSFAESEVSHPPETSTSSSRRHLRPRSVRPSELSRPPDATNRSQREPDWIGQIVAINLDGSITVRLGGLQPTRDVLVDADSVLAIIDDRDGADHTISDSLMDLDSWMDSDSEWSEGSPEPIEETVEYEGGQRLDNDSGDENWLSDEGEVFEDAEEQLPDQDGDVQMSTSEPSTAVATSSKPQRLLSHLQTLPGGEAPPQFLVLDREPPADQFGLHSASSSQTSLKRISKEHKILSTSLPEGEIYVRTYESRLDLLRCLIIGPRDTPYENAPFLIDLYLPEKFPDAPPTAHFHSWTSGLGRINPNLYEEGKICLSLLGTWDGKQETERWSPQATILQLLVSLQGLVFVKKPFYNEAGFEGYENDRAYTRESEQYSEKAFVMARGFVKHALLRPPGGLEDILAWLYLPHDIGNPGKSLLVTVIQRGKSLLDNSDRARANQDDSLLDSQGEKGDDTAVFLKPLSRGASVMLKRSLGELEAQLEQFTANAGQGERSAP